MRYVYMIVVTPLHNFRWIWAPGFVLHFGAFKRFSSFMCIETEFQHVLSLSVFIDAESFLFNLI